MMPTSLAAHADLEMILEARQLLAWTTLQTHGPLTGQEIAKLAGLPGLWKRLSELKGLSLVANDLPARKCSVTGRLALVWRVLSATPHAARPARYRRAWYLGVPINHSGATYFHFKRDKVESFVKAMAPDSYEIVKVREVREIG